MHIRSASTPLRILTRNPHFHHPRLKLPLSTGTRRAPLRSTAPLSTRFNSHFHTPPKPLLANFFQPTLPKMASYGLDDSLLTFLKTHAPNDAFEETDAVKASQKLFPETKYEDAEKTEISQWLITASHLGSNVRQFFPVPGEIYADLYLD
jgi:aminoacyl tRNA synthase complex-interacting multifunctional protein 1